jgi:hypothetical protein
MRFVPIANSPIFIIDLRRDLVRRNHRDHYYGAVADDKAAHNKITATIPNRRRKESTANQT